MDAGTKAINRVREEHRDWLRARLNELPPELEHVRYEILQQVACDVVALAYTLGAAERGESE